MAAIVAWAAAIYELTLDVESDESSGTPCAGTGVDQIPRVVDDVSWGCRRSYNNAAGDARRVCGTLAGACTGTCPGGGTCTPKLNIINTNQFSYGVACRTVMEYNCQCRC